MAKNKTKDWGNEEDEAAPAAATPPAPPASDTPQAAPAAATVVVEEKLPSDLKGALEELKTANELPERNAEEQVAKHVRLTRAQRHYHRLCQGDVPTGGQDIAELKTTFNAQSVAAREILVNDLCRQFPVLGDYIAELKSKITAG